MNNTLINIASSQQQMVDKAQGLEQQLTTAFNVTANPIDQQPTQALNAPVSFSGSMHQVLNSVNAQQQAASEKMTAVETGQSDDLVGAMIASQKASLSFSGLMQVRNKVVSAFDDVMKMPV